MRVLGAICLIGVWYWVAVWAVSFGQAVVKATREARIFKR